MRVKANIIIIVCLSFIFFTMQNCGEFHSMQDSDFNSSLLDSSDISGEGQRVPFQMLNKKQILSSLVTATGVTEANESLLAANISFSPILSEESDLIKYNPPRGMTYANLAGEACHQLIGQEKSEQNKRIIRYGLPVDVRDITQQDLEDTIRSFARSFWSRNETIEELDIILEGLAEFESSSEVLDLSDQLQAERITIYLCTSMLSVLDAITY